MRRFLLLVLLFSGSTFAEVQTGNTPPLLKTNHPDFLKVTETDTVWSVARVFLLNPWRWEEAWGETGAPEHLYPGDIIRVQKENQNVFLQHEPATDNGHTLRLGPQARVYEFSANKTGDKTLPYSRIAAFTDRGIIITSYPDIDRLPRIVSINEGESLGSKGEAVYAKGLTPIQQGETFNVYRQKAEYVMNSQLLGIGMTYIGKVEAGETGQIISRLNIRESVKEIRAGDILLADTQNRDVKELNLDKGSVNSSIVALLSPSEYSGRYGNVVILGGSRQGVRPGHTFALYTPLSEMNRHDMLLSVHQHSPIGKLLVYRSFDNLSHAMILESSAPVKKGFLLRPATL